VAAACTPRGSDALPVTARPLARLAGPTLALVSLSLCLGTLELVARMVVGRAQARPRTSESFLQFDPGLGWNKAPNETVELWAAESHVRFETNSHGLRGPDRPHAKPPDTRRVLLLGDSFLEAGTVEEPRSVRARLEEALRGSGCGPFEVINGGTSGYSTDQELLFFREDGRLYQPDVVVLFFFSNDLPGNLDRRKKPYFEIEHEALVLRNWPVPSPPLARQRRKTDPPRALGPWHGSYALRFLGLRTESALPRLHRRLAALGLVEPARDHPPTRSWLLSYGPDSEETLARWQITDALLQALRDEVVAVGARLVVFHVPASFEVDAADWRRTRERWDLDDPGYDAGRVAERLHAVCRRLGVELVDPREALRKAQLAGERAYFRLDPHWTALGHRVAAEELLPLVRAAVPACPR
jgi:hypothetical protein